MHRRGIASLILCGGFGTRLRPLTCTRPKPLLPFLNKPLIFRQIESLVKVGVESVFLAAGYGADLIEKEISSREFEVEVKVVKEGKPLGTGGAIVNASRYLENYDRFYVFNADIVSEVDLTSVLNTHLNHGRKVTVVFKEVKDVSRFGVAVIRGGLVERFVEKPKPEQVKSKWVNAGIYLMEKDALEFFPRELREISLEREVFPRIAERGEMAAYLYRGVWFDIGTLRDYLEATRGMLDKLLKDTESLTLIDSSVKVDEKAVIGPYCVIGKNSEVGEESMIKNSVLFDGVRVEDGCQVINSIISFNCVIRRRARIISSALGEWVEVAEGVTVGKGARICPGKKINADVGEGEVVI